MAAISQEQKNQIISLLREGQLPREEIAVTVGVAPSTVSAMHAHFTRGTYDGLCATEADTDELIEASEVTFGLERDMQGALRANIQQLEPGLQIADDGKERTTDAGRVDITTKDSNGTTVVIELKAATASPEALTQLLAYMGVIGKQEGKLVRGILVAGDFHPRIVFAAQGIPNIQLRRYHFQFTFETVE